MGKYLKLFNAHTEYEAYTADTENFLLPNVSFCLDTVNEVHYNPYVEPVDPCASKKVETTYEWIEIGGKKWATKNVGALTETDYGQFFTWGSTEGYNADQVGEQGDTECKWFDWLDYELSDGEHIGASGIIKYNRTDNLTTLEAVDDVATVQMGAGWRMPTDAEFTALRTATTSAWTSDYEGSGVAGVVLTDKTDATKKLFFPAAGIAGNGNVSAINSQGRYWTNKMYDGESIQSGYNMYIYNGKIMINEFGRSSGVSVRGIYVG